MRLLRRRMECTIALTLCLTMGYALFSAHSQRSLAEDLVRLRVVANSDSAYDQSVKLAVRDAVLEEIAGWEIQPDCAQEMMNDLDSRRGCIAQAVRQTLDACGSDDRFAIRLDREYYPTRTYETFSLPAGEYQGLRIFLGEGAGHNWWCVIYPALCLDTVSAEQSLTGEQRGLIHRDTGEYAVRFRMAEVVGELEALLG